MQTHDQEASSPAAGKPFEPSRQAIPYVDPEKLMAARLRFFAIMDSLTPEELEGDIFAGRPGNVSILEMDPDFEPAAEKKLSEG